MIDKDKIFKLFVDGKEISGDKTNKEIKDFMNGPYAKIGMFVKLIQNHEVFHKKLEKFLKQEQPDYNVESTKEASEYTVYHRAWSYIKQVDIDKSDDVKAIISFDPKIFYKTLNSAVDYFENYEEYEKCAHLHKMKEIVKVIPK
jgi:hypothetical protein|tara:strand:+ start:366 stop:797 length:432 start_codon:yes stop_codon:yes gene_type:complete